MALSEKSLQRKKEYDIKYKKDNCVQLATRFSKVYEADIIEKLNSVPNKRQYIINLIRKDIESSGK